MKLVRLVITAAVVAGSSGLAFAQQGTTSPATQSGATQSVANPTVDAPRNWIVSGFLGSNFGSSRNNSLDLPNVDDLGSNKSTSANFGGQVGYLGRGVIGGEFLWDYSPGFELNNALLDRSPNLNSYMFNLIAVAPFGYAKRYDPYFSGGIGKVSLSSDIFITDPLTPGINTTQAISGGAFGWDLGAGVMAWSERNWGFRGDLRYYKTSSSGNGIPDLEDIGDGTAFSKALLTDISFWKVNAGIGFRW